MSRIVKKYFFKFKKIKPGYIILFIIFFLLLLSRRFDQFFSPQVWCEDGTQILNGFIDKGWLTMFDPVNGYLVLVPKLISAISLLISFVYYPFVSTIISWLFIIFALFAIAFSPTKLKAKILCALSVLIIPADAEVFGLPLYSFWWSSLLLFLVIFWDQTKGVVLRLVYILFAGLSAPIIVIILPFLYLRAFIYKLNKEYFIAGFATIIASIQVYLILNDSREASYHHLKSLFVHIIPKIFGGFLIGNWVENKSYLWIAGIILLSSLIFILSKRPKDYILWGLWYLLTMVLVISAIRVDFGLIHLRLSGQRYFFFPFILIYWLLIQGYYKLDQQRFLKILIVIFIGLSLFNSSGAWYRNHDDLDWKIHTISCADFPVYPIPVHSSGKEFHAWYVELQGNNCRKFLQNDRIFFSKQSEEIKVYPFSVFEFFEKNQKRKQNLKVRIIDSTLTEVSDKSLEIENAKIFKSNKSGRIVLEMAKGGYIFYKSSIMDDNLSFKVLGQEDKFLSRPPIGSKKWMKVSFSNQKLPDKFQVVIEDKNPAKKEWFSIGVLSSD